MTAKLQTIKLNLNGCEKDSYLHLIQLGFTDSY